MAKAIGIDLGTTNSCVSVVEGGIPVIIPNNEGERTTASVVAFTAAGEILVGSSAKRQYAVNPKGTVSSIKRHMGEDWSFSTDGKRYIPQEISAMILRKLKKDAESYLGHPVTDAVITVPAYFNDTQRQATKDAGTIAGLNVLRIINEPTSAALAYGLNNGRSQKIMVYDFGGGTFDVSVIEISDGTIEVLSTAGDNHLGGDDIDQKVARWIGAQFQSQHHVDLSRDRAAWTRVLEAAETAKKELSSSGSVNINLPFITMTKEGPLHLDLNLSRSVFNELIREFLDRTAVSVQTALRDAGISAAELGLVLLVGGSTRIPAVSEKVKALTGITPSKSINPDECVAMGAAVQAETLEGGTMLMEGSENQILLLDVTPMGLSIETLGGVATTIVKRNTTIPVRYSQVFSTAAPFQTTVEIHVLQGDRPMARDNKTIGKFRLSGIRPAPAGVPQIEVSFDIDVNGILTVSARDLGTGRQQSITITEDGRMSEAEIERARWEAEQYASQDGIRKEYIQLRQDAEKLLARAERALYAGKKTADKGELRQVKNDCAKLRKALGKVRTRELDPRDMEPVREAMEELKGSSEHLIEMTEGGTV